MYAFHKKCLILALTLGLLTVLPRVAWADNIQGQPIYAQNNTNYSIWVAARYIPAGSNSYVADGFWQVDPGQKMLILYNNGRYIDFYARDDHGGVWTGNDATANVRGETLNMIQEDTGTGYNPWTMNFNPAQ
jgi:uncharacterized membrane protein